MKRRPRRWLAALAGAALLAGCAEPLRDGPLGDIAAPAAPAVEALAWPGPPEDPRVAFETTFATPADLGVDQGVLAWLERTVFGARPVHLVRPMAVVTVGEVVFVADPGAHGVHRFDRARSRYDLLRRADERPLPSPVGMAASDDGRVYLTDSELAGIFVVDAGADEVRRLPIDVELAQPTGIAINPHSSELYVTDTLGHRVHVFSRDGHHLRSFGAHDDAAGHFNYPTYLWFTPAGELLVADSLNFRVQGFAADDRWLFAFGHHGDGSGDIARLKGVATDSDGHVYVVDALFHAVQIFDRDGTLLLAFGNPGQRPGEFWLPTGIFIDTEDRIYVADAYNRRVQVFRYIGGGK